MIREWIVKPISMSLSTLVATIVFPAMFTFYTDISRSPVRFIDYHPDQRPAITLTLIPACAPAPLAPPELPPLESAIMLEGGKTVRLQLAVAPDGVINEIMVLDDLSSGVAHTLVNEARKRWRFDRIQRSRWTMQCGRALGRTTVVTIKSPWRPLIL